jgi:hypothetical protein
MSPFDRWAGILVLCSGTMASDLAAVRFMSAVEKWSQTKIMAIKQVWHNEKEPIG